MKPKVRHGVELCCDNLDEHFFSLENVTEGCVVIWGLVLERSGTSWGFIKVSSTILGVTKSDKY